MVVKKYIDIEVEVALSESSKQSKHLSINSEVKTIDSAMTMEFE